jgi:hypothetical protein
VLGFMGFFARLRRAQNDIQGFGRVVEHSLHGHLFFGADFVERIIHSAQALGFEAVEDRTRGSVVTKPVDYCMHQVIKSAFLEGNDRFPVNISQRRLSDNYRICCFVELILLQEVPARKGKHSPSLDGRGLG